MLQTEDTPYINEGPSDLRKRIISFFLDMLIIVVLHFGAFFAATAIYGTTSICKDKQEKLNSNIQEIYHLQEDSHLYNFIGEGDDKYSKYEEEDSRFNKWIQSHIKLTFRIDPSAFSEKGITTLNIEDSIPEANYDNDHLAFFYADFVERRNEELKIIDLKNKSTKQYYTEDVFEKQEYLIGDQEKHESMWVFDKTNYSLPRLTSKAAYLVYNYIKLKASETISVAYNNAAKKTYSAIWKVEKNDLGNAPGFKVYYDVYTSVYHSMLLDVDACSIISYIIVYVGGYLLPILITKKHVSLGKKAVGIMVIDSGGRELSKAQKIWRPIMRFFGFFGFTIISNFFCQGTNSAWMRPIFSMGSFGVSLLVFNLLFLIIDLVSFIFVLVTNNRSSIADLILKTFVIDKPSSDTPKNRWENNNIKNKY